MNPKVFHRRNKFNFTTLNLNLCWSVIKRASVFEVLTLIFHFSKRLIRRWAALDPLCTALSCEGLSKYSPISSAYPTILTCGGKSKGRQNTNRKERATVWNPGEPLLSMIQRSTCPIVTLNQVLLPFKGKIPRTIYIQKFNIESTLQTKMTRTELKIETPFLIINPLYH